MDREKKAAELQREMEPGQRKKELDKQSEVLEAENRFLRAGIENLRLRRKKEEEEKTFNQWLENREEEE